MQRPDHPDFWLISQALIDVDALSQASGDTEDSRTIMARYVDPDSGAYAATQRALAMVGPRDKELLAKAATLWLDGFMAGIKYQHLKTSGAQNLTEDDLHTMRGGQDDPAPE